MTTDKPVNHGDADPVADAPDHDTDSATVTRLSWPGPTGTDGTYDSAA